MTSLCQGVKTKHYVSMTEKLGNYGKSWRWDFGDHCQSLCVFFGRWCNLSNDRNFHLHFFFQLPSPAFSLHHWNDGYSLLRVAGRGKIYFIDTFENSYELMEVMRYGTEMLFRLP